ncbi:LysM peptidoglycan-binding domain-containing protein [Bacillus sp. FJAT-27986]|uniref:LysM peptidoglycan-binding domain-containing protein n=1 Tax=Bacillus sp. FJAT-27986 TaxID=1743146 RepID=UPI00080AF0AC|nr:LysM peptidoglycan-binding domain-containing protein [Bacillus sp. FJAT-27986]OCA84740.1 hypothetical protein A8L44_10150 [Bacillus sp. FJAT-27986]
MKIKIALTMTSVILLSPMSTFAETYTVRSGDNLWNISERNNVNFQALLEVNNQIPNKDLIYPDQVINLPDAMKEYTVLSGDTLWGIARKLDVDFLELLNVNSQIHDKDLIFPGQKINLPKVTESEKTNSEVTKPEETTPEVMVPVETTPEVTESVETTPEVTEPVETTPEVTEPVENTPEVTEPVETTPEVTEPVENTPEVTEPVETTPEVTEPVENTPEVTGPVETTPEVTEPVETTPEVTEPEGNDQAIVNQIVALVNEERAKNGLQPLRNNADLSVVAYTKAVDMSENGYFAHTSPTYGSPFDMMKAFGITYVAAAENIAQGHRTAEAVMEGWMDSEGHRENILNPNYTEIGIGYEKYEHYWVQMFIQN